jgi:nucleoside-diphosphate-sugar epimerase
MKVLLTGASGFVGSHILDVLCAAGLDVVVLLRPASNRRFLEPHLRQIEPRTGTLDDPGSLAPALAGITHVIHCAGAIKAARSAEFYRVNQAGTLNLVEAANLQPGLERLVLISSLAAAGPAGPDRPAREEDPPHPVSIYGRSKLAAEQEVRQRCRAEFVILRPPAVYGPRDVEFLRLFRAATAHLEPRPARQSLSLVFVRDLAHAVHVSLTHPAAARQTYFVAAREVVTARELVRQVARQVGRWTFPLPLPALALWPFCLAHELRARLTGRASVLSLQKFAELRAPGWVCDPRRFAHDTGQECGTTLAAGLAETLAWYRREGWL